MYVMLYLLFWAFSIHSGKKWALHRKNVFILKSTICEVTVQNHYPMSEETHTYLYEYVCMCVTEQFLRLYSACDRWMSEYGALVEWYRQGKTEVLRDKPVAVPFGPQKIPHGLYCIEIVPWKYCVKQVTGLMASASVFGVWCSRTHSPFWAMPHPMMCN